MKLADPNAASPALHRNLTLELVRVTERAAIAAADWRG
jgi:fructose-1,6-bisphosphatase II / sedoheptulose-1,7-bisphosphatase